MKSRTFKATTAAVTAGMLVASATMPAFAAQNSAKTIANGQDVKNVIIMISDGWGYNQILATDYFTDGKVGTQLYEKFPTKVSMSTYASGGSYDPQLAWSDFDYIAGGATDSAAAGTAMSTGEKTSSGAIGVDDTDPVENLTHVGEIFEDMGRSTGVVSSVEFAHATPASFVAHNTDRGNYADIANEMIYDSATDVIIGCGNPDFDNCGKEATMNARYVGGEDTWSDITDDWSVDGSDANGDGAGDAWDVITTKAEFEAMASGATTSDRLLGIPEVYTTFQQARSGDGEAGAYEVALISEVPDLATMSSAALNVLDNNEEGFFLMIEGGAIDWAGHANQSGRLIEEQEDFNQAVESVVEWVNQNSNWGETLVVVTGDHETGYLTGTEGVYDEVENNSAGIMPTMAWNSGGHTNQLIPFYAKGAGAQIFKKMADGVDPVRGAYLDNTEIMDTISALIN